MSKRENNVPGKIVDIVDLAGVFASQAKKITKGMTRKEIKAAEGKAMEEGLAGSLRGEIKLSDRELRQARDQFSKQWPRKLS